MKTDRTANLKVAHKEFKDNNYIGMNLCFHYVREDIINYCIAPQLRKSLIYKGHQQRESSRRLEDRLQI